MDIQETGYENVVMESSHSEGPVVFSCEYGNGPSGSKKARDFFTI